MSKHVLLQVCKEDYLAIVAQIMSKTRQMMYNNKIMVPNINKNNVNYFQRFLPNLSLYYINSYYIFQAEYYYKKVGKVYILLYVNIIND